MRKTGEKGSHVENPILSALLVIYLSDRDTEKRTKKKVTDRR